MGSVRGSGEKVKGDDDLFFLHLFLSHRKLHLGTKVFFLFLHIMSKGWREVVNLPNL